MSALITKSGIASNGYLFSVIAFEIRASLGEKSQAISAFEHLLYSCFDYWSDISAVFVEKNLPIIVCLEYCLYGDSSNSFHDSNGFVVKIIAIIEIIAPSPRLFYIIFEVELSELSWFFCEL